MKGGHRGYSRGLAVLLVLAIAAAAQPGPFLRSENGVRPIVPWRKSIVSAQDRLAEAKTRYFWAAFTSIPGAPVHQGLEALGAEVVGFAGKSGDAYIYKVRLGQRRDEARAFLRGRPGFLNLLPVVAEEKLAPRFFNPRARALAQMVPGPKQAAAGNPASGPLGKAAAAKTEKATVWFHRPLPWVEARTLLAGKVDSVLYDPERTMAHVVAAPERIRALADLDEVARVGAFSPRAPTNDRARRVTRVSELQAPFLDTLTFPPTADWNRGRPFTGEGILVCVNEGLDTNHLDFREAAGAGSVLRRGPSDSWTTSFHGTHVAGIAAGNGWGSEAAGGNRYQFRGMAPKATLIPYWESGDVNNHSFTNGFEGYYNYADAGVDERFSNHNGIQLDANNVAVWAAANNGGSHPQYGTQRGWYSLLINAKNPIKVAAAGADGRRAAFSSLGPTRDGRIGPDVTAPGEAVYSIREGGQGYLWMSGTSMASPQVSGIVALLLQKYQDQVLRPLGLDVHNQPPWNSTMKAILIHTARDMVDLEGAGVSDANPEFAAAGYAGMGAIYGPGPDFATGYGMVDAKRAADYMDPARFRETVVSAGQTRSFTLDVGPGQPTLRVSLAWDDPPFQGANDSSGAFARKLVNDLDLRLVSPSGRVHLPWVLDHSALHRGSVPSNGLDPVVPADILYNPAVRGRDTLNNVEVVDVGAPEAGLWTVEVEGAVVAVDQSLEAGLNQDFSLVSDIAPESPSAAPAPDLMVSDISWTPERPSPNERLRFTALVRNIGEAPVPAGLLEVRFHIAGAVVARGEVEAADLEPGATLSVTGDIGVDGGDGAWTAFSGLSAVSAWADPADRIAEARESNNARLETLDVPKFPRPWELSDIGAVGVPGFGYFYDQSFFVTGEGTDIQGSADACAFVHREMAGDGEIRARVNWLDNTHPWAKAGIMLRDGLGAGARNVFVGVTPENGIVFQHRAAEDGPTSHAGVEGYPPAHLRLVRAGDVFTAFLSADGREWIRIGSATVRMGAALRAGMAVTSRQEGVSTTGSFGPVEVMPARREASIAGRVAGPDGRGLAGVEVRLGGAALRAAATDASGAFAFEGLAVGSAYTVTPSRSGYVFAPASAAFPSLAGPAAADFSARAVPLPDPWSSADVGSPVLAGSAASPSDGAFVLEGSGADVRGDADQFRFAWSRLDGDGALTARAASLAATHPWAKAGIMIREDLAAGARHVFLALTPGNGLAFQHRAGRGGESAHLAAGSADSRWIRLTRSGSTFRAWTSRDGKSWAQAGQADVPMGAEVLAGLAVTAHDPAALARAAFDAVALVRTASPFRSGDVGAVGLAGETRVSGGVHTLRGSGADIWGGADAFHFSSASFPSDGEIVARIVSMQYTDPWAKAGVMIRESADPGSRHVFMALTGGNGAAFQRRAVPGWESAHSSAGPASAPVWFKLVRSGDMFRGYRSANGSDWILAGEERIALHGELLAGLAVTSHNDGSLCEAVFDNVSLRHHPGWALADVGSVGLEGSFTAAHGTFSVSGSGADIWGRADAFAFVHRELDGDGEISAKVAGLAATHPWAKAGLMIREGTGAGDRHVTVSLTGSNGVEVLRRTAAGGASAATHAGATAPIWLRLARAGDVITAYRSTDGLAWSSLGSVTVALPRQALIGLAVCSHDDAVTTSAAFSNVSMAE